MATPFETFVNGELPKRVSTEDSPISWTPGRVVVTTGVGLGVTTDEFPAPPVLSVNSDVGDVVITAASISAIPTSQKGAANGVASLDANGFVPISQMNPGVVERLYVVTDETARFALTTAQVQNGDVVKQELPAPAAMYYVQDDTNLDSELGYAIFSAGTAAAVAWSGVTGVPQILLDLENIAGASNGDILQFIDGTWVKQSRNAYVSALNLQTSEIEGLDTALGDKQDRDLTLDALSDLPDTGFIVQIAPDSFASRSLEAGDGISITFPDGVDGDPLIAFQEGPAGASGTHGDENTYLGLQIDSHGRTTAVTEYKLQKDTVFIPNSTDPFPLTTKTLYIIGDFLTTTYGDLYLQLPPLTASTIIEVQLALNIDQIGYVYLIPSGTDLVFGLNGPVDINSSYLDLAPGCTAKLFFHSVGLGWVGQANHSDHFIDPIIHPSNSTSWAAGHRIVSESTGDCDVVIPDGPIHLGYPILHLAFDRSTDVLTGTRVDGLEVTTLLDQDHMGELFNPYGGSAGVPLEVGRTYRPAGSVAIYSPNTPVYLPSATADAFNSHESVPIRLMTGNSILDAGYLRLTPQVGETMYHSAINGSVFTSTYLPIPNNSEVTCYMIGVGEWYVDIRQDSNYLDTDHFTLVDPTLRSKSVKFNVAPVGGVGSAQRVITVPDADVSLGKVPTGVTPTYATGRLMVPLADGTSIPLSAFGGTRLANLNSPATVLTANGHYLFYSNTGSYYTVICALVLPTAPDDMTYVRISNISSLNSFSVDAGATVAPGGSDKINGVVATFSITDYLVNYRNAVITFTYSAFHENWTVSVLGDLIKPGTVAIYDADKTNTTTLTPVTDLTANRVITLPDANVDLGKVLSNISYAPTTGVITLTNVDASTFATTNIGAIADDMLRIQATGAATKKMGFNCSAVTAGQTRIVTMPDANVDLGQMAKGSFTPVELLASSATQNLAPNYSYYLPATYAGALNLVMPTSAAIGTTFDIGSIYSTGVDGTSGVNLTALNLTIPAGEYITGWGGAGLGATINLLVSYVTASGGYTTPNFTQGCTFRLTKTGATSWAIKPTFGSVLPKRFLVKNEGGAGGTVVSTAVPAGTLRELTLPDADVNLGNVRILEDLITDQVITPNGFLPAAGVLANTISAGVAYVQGVRVSVPLTNKTWTANKDTYVDLSSTGVYTYVEVANGAGVPAVTPLHMRVAKVVSGATTLGAITMLKAPVTSYGTGSGANIYGANNTLLGKALAPIATTAYGNTIVGNTQCAALSTGYENVVIGAATPVLNTGYHNVVIGKGSGAALTTSQYNVLIGYEAGADNSTILNGIVAIGYSAARHSTGAQITAIGQSAGGANTTGLRWTAIGDGAGSTATASDWTAVGSAATTGTQGISIGSYAGYNTTGAGNISIGYLAGRTSASDAFSAEAISIGLAASYQSVRGTGSIAIGTRAGSGTVANHKSTSDSYAIYIGWEASRSSTIPTATSLSNVIAIGTNAEVASSNSCVIGAAASPYKVGINMTTPTARLHLPAGTATAGTAPLKLTSGTNLTTPENGAVEYNGSFYFTQGGVRYSLGDLPNVATGNTLGGTNPRVLAGANNTVSGTSNVVVTGDNNVISGTNQVVLTGSYTADVTWNNAVIQALSYGGASFRQTVAVSTALSGNTFWGSYIFTACTTGGAYGAATVPKTYLSVHTTTAGTQTFRTLAIHTLTIIGRTANVGGSTVNNTYEFVGKRRVVVTNVSGVINLVITTEGTDYNPVGTVALNITNDAGKLKIAPVFTSEAADQTSSAWNILVESMYTTL